MNGFTPRYAEKRCWQLLKERSVEYESLATSKRLVRLLIGSGQRGKGLGFSTVPQLLECRGPLPLRDLVGVEHQSQRALVAGHVVRDGALDHGEGLLPALLLRRVQELHHLNRKWNGQPQRSRPWRLVRIRDAQAWPVSRGEDQACTRGKDQACEPQRWESGGGNVITIRISVITIYCPMSSRGNKW